MSYLLLNVSYSITKTRQARGVGHENYTKGNYYDGNEEEHFSPGKSFTINIYSIHMQ